MPLWLKWMVAEAVGTFFLVFPGVGAPMLAGYLHAPVPLLDVALANGLGLGIGISATMAISGGALNPAVSIGLWSVGKLKTSVAGLYIVSEIVGAVFACLLLAWLLPGSVATGVPLPGSGMNGLRAAGVEAVLTFLLMVAVWTTAVEAGGLQIGGLGVGLVVIFDVLVGGPLTGAAMNPARALGPELVAGVWRAAWVYWAGPIAGALVASVLYRLLWQEKTRSKDASTASPPRPAQS